MPRPFARPTWTYVLNGVPFTLPADLPHEAVVRPVRSGSTLDVFRQAVGVYRRHFPTIAAIFLIPMAIGELLVRYVRFDETLVEEIHFLIRWAATVAAFAPLVDAVSDICIGNRPRFARSYRRAGWRAFIKVSIACAVATVLMIIPFVVAYFVIVGAASIETSALDPAVLMGFVLVFGIVIGGGAVLFAARMLVWFLYVPIIAVLEPRLSLVSAFPRSRWLGLGYARRTVAVLVVAVLILLIAGGIAAVMSNVNLRHFGVLFARLLGPIPYIAATLIYYDLRARKEGYGIAERPEELH